MKFPVTVEHRNAKVKIFAPAEGFPYYRIYWRVSGKSHTETHKTYGEARQAAEAQAKELAKGSSSAALSQREAASALAVRDALQAHYQATGRRYSAIELVAAALEAEKLLAGKTSLAEAARAYLQTVATIQRKPLADAVAEFVQGREAKTESKNGRRAQLNRTYANNVANWLGEFARTVQNTAVCDLRKEFINLWLESKAGLSPKSRNDRRAALHMFLEWCTKRDYLPAQHRLEDADAMARETVETGETEYYSPAELLAMLEHARGPLRAVIALCGLAGVRIEEACRLSWENIWHIPGHVEIVATKAKTRARRLVEMCPALSAWLAAYRDQETGPVWSLSTDSFQIEFTALLASIEKETGVTIPRRRNGLRHAFCTYHFALHSNEGLTAAMAGNSPVVIHSHYKGLATRAEAEQYFAVSPTAPANVVALAQPPKTATA